MTMQDARLFIPRTRLLALLFIILVVLSGPGWLSPLARALAAAGGRTLAQDEATAIEIFQAASPSVVYITSVELRQDILTLNVYEIPRGTGSGFIWDREGRIVTNYHVIEDASNIEVTLADGSSLKASLVGVAPDKDLAVIQVKAPPGKLKPIAVGSSKDLLVGQRVYAIGNPFGLDHTMTSGIVSALGREIEAATGRTIEGVIQTDAAINPGNSGGPLLDSGGRLIGVNTAIYSPSGASAGIGFAVPVEEVKSVVPILIKHGRIIQPGIGVTVAHERLAQRLGLEEGALIIYIKPGGSAEAAGLRGTRRSPEGIVLGDIIVSVEGNPVRTPDDLRLEFDRHRVGDRVTLGILRGSKEMQVKVALREIR